jgi:hypothetical protein
MLTSTVNLFDSPALIVRVMDQQVFFKYKVCWQQERKSIPAFPHFQLAFHQVSQKGLAVKKQGSLD